MEIKEAIQLLKDYNHWRRFDGEIEDSPKMPNPKEVGIAIDKVVSEFENLFISGVSGSLPYDFIKKAMDYSTPDKRIKSGNYMDIYDDDRLLLIKCIYDCWQ